MRHAQCRLPHQSHPPSARQLRDERLSRTLGVMHLLLLLLDVFFPVTARWAAAAAVVEVVMVEERMLRGLPTACPSRRRRRRLSHHRRFAEDEGFRLGSLARRASLLSVVCRTIFHHHRLCRRGEARGSPSSPRARARHNPCRPSHLLHQPPCASTVPASPPPPPARHPCC